MRPKLTVGCRAIWGKRQCSITSLYRVKRVILLMADRGVKIRGCDTTTTSLAASAPFATAQPLPVALRDVGGSCFRRGRRTEVGVPRRAFGGVRLRAARGSFIPRVEPVRNTSESAPSETSLTLFLTFLY